MMTMEDPLEHLPVKRVNNNRGNDGCQQFLAFFSQSFFDGSMHRCLASDATILLSPNPKPLVTDNGIFIE